MAIFFTSDTHFFHNNILKFGRSKHFKDIYEHDETLIRNWNNVVAPSDTVYHLGDFCLKNDQDILRRYLVRLNGKKHLIYGNHDNDKVHSRFLNEHLWESISNYKIIEVTYRGNIYKVVLSHFPILEYYGAFKPHYFHLYGHIHDINNYDQIYEKLEFKAAHVGVDTSNRFQNTDLYTPIELKDIIRKLNIK